jgi:hypothetical protein
MSSKTASQQNCKVRSDFVVCFPQMICIGSMDLSFGIVSRLREEKSRNKSLPKLSYLSLMTSNKDPLPKFLNVRESLCSDLAICNFGHGFIRWASSQVFTAAQYGTPRTVSLSDIYYNEKANIITPA